MLAAVASSLTEEREKDPTRVERALVKQVKWKFQRGQCIASKKNAVISTGAQL